jgi:hypothetical protein
MSPSISKLPGVGHTGNADDAATKKTPNVAATTSVVATTQNRRLWPRRKLLSVLIGIPAPPSSLKGRSTLLAQLWWFY